MELSKEQQELYQKTMKEIEKQLASIDEYIEEEIKKLKETKKRNGFAVKYFNYKGELAKSKPPIVLWIYNAIEGTNTYQKVVMGLLITDIKEYSYDKLPEEWKKGLEWMKDVYGTNLKSELSDSKLCVKIEDVWEEEVDITKFSLGIEILALGYQQRMHPEWVEVDLLELKVQKD